MVYSNDNPPVSQQNAGGMPCGKYAADAISLPTEARKSFDHLRAQLASSKDVPTCDAAIAVDENGATTAYGAKALRLEVEQLANATAGTRNDSLNRAAFAVAQLVAAGEINMDEADEALREACMRNGLIDDDGLRTVEKTINSAFQAAKQKPRTTIPNSLKTTVYRDVVSASIGWDEAPIAFNEQDAPLPDYTGAPKVFIDFVEGLSEQIQARPEFAIAGVLGATAAALQGKFVVQAPSGYTESTNLYLICVGDSGERKSPTCQECSAPLAAFEAQLQAEIRPFQVAATNKRTALQQAKERLMRQAAKAADEGHRAELLDKMAAFDEEIPEDVPMPQLLLDDTTPEAMAQVLAENNEKGVIFEAEGGFLENLAGRYGKGAPNLDLVLKGYSGERVRINRKGHEPTILQHPLLTIVLLPQPFALSDCEARRAFSKRGLDARIIFLTPPSRLGSRRVDARRLADGAKRAYHQKITSLFQIEVDCDGEGHPVPFVLRLTPEASQLFTEFDQFIEQRLAPGGEFEGIRDWCAKTPGRVLRIAAAFHALKHDLPQEYEIAKDTMGLAIRFGKSLIPHTKIAYEVMWQDFGIELAKRILAWIVRNRFESFKLREAQQVFKTQSTNVAKIKEAMAVLVERGYLREVDVQGPKGGRHSTVFLVNPKTFA